MDTWTFHVLATVLVHLACVSPVQNQVTPLVEYSILEEQPAPQYIGNLLVNTGLNFSVPPEYQKDAKFSFHTTSQDYVSYFTIEDGTGVFHTQKKLDREELCPLRDPCTFNLTINVKVPTSDGIELRVYTIRIRIEDINDHVPTFPNNHSTKFISETRPIGTLLDIPAAIDRDSPKFAIKEYKLSNTLSKFELDDSIGGSTPKLKVKGELNREEEPFYSVQVLAVDGGTPPQTGTMTVDISITDANDNKPVFVNHTYHVTIEENTPIGTTILQVHADDHDSGENGLISYSFEQTTQEAYRNLFEIEEFTGSLKIVGEIDYDRALVQKDYTIGLIASDNNGEYPLTDQATVEVHVKDVNDNTPDIVVNTGDDGQNVLVSENLKPDSFVTHISVIDRDSGDNGNVVCFLTDPFFSLKPLPYPKEFELKTKVTLNREEQEVYAVTVTCEDLAETPNIKHQTIEIFVRDENDHAPKFEQDIYPIIISENNQVGIQISQVRATDDDIGENARISYSILPPYDELLAIDINNGYIYTQSIFDYETQTRYNITVMATDHGETALSTTATLQVQIMDTNDHPPRFNQSHYIFATLENQDAGTEVGTVTATDLDSEGYNDITYTLDISSPDASSFRLEDTKHGKLSLRKGLDREKQDKYSFTVIASNAGSSLHTATNVTVYIGDQNDNAPLLDFPRPDNNSVQISAFAEKGSLITQIKAYDNDAGRNSYLRYSILAGNVAAVFTINPNTGELFVNKSMEQYGDETVMLSVLVKDRGEPPLYSVGDLNIFVNASEVVVPQPVSTVKKTTNVQLVIILCLSVLAVGLFLAVLIVLLTMRRKKANSVKKAETRYNVDITPAQMTAGGELRASRESVIDSPTVRTKDHTDPNGNENSGYDRQHPPTYSEALKSPPASYVTKDSKSGSRKVHFAETDSAYDSLDKELDEQNSSDSIHYTQQHQQPGGQEKATTAGGRPLYMEQHRQRLLYGSPTASPIRPRSDLKIRISESSLPADIESDQGSSIDSGRGPSEDEHSRHNISLPGGKFVSLLPDPHQRTYPDLVKCSCGSHSKNGRNYHKQPHKVHKKGCPQHHSPPHTSRQEIDSLNDFQNLLGLPPKTYKKKLEGGQHNNNNPGHSAELPGSVSNDKYCVQNPIPSHRSHSPHVHTYGGSQVNNQFTQQCYNDIAQHKAAAGSHKPMEGRQRNSLGRDSTSTWRDDSDGESDGGSSTTSGSFEVASMDTVVERHPTTIHIPKIQQVYV